MNSGVFFDRDGTLIKDVHYLKDPNDIITIKDVSESLMKIKDAGHLVFMHTNQSGISRGYYDWDDVHACNQKMLELYGLEPDFWDDVCIAPESPNDSDLGWRKPSAKYELEMIKKYNLDISTSWMVGDKWIDAETAINSNINPALVKTGKTISNETEKSALVHQVPICENLQGFCENCLSL